MKTLPSSYSMDLSTKGFALSYLGSIFGEATGSGLDGELFAFSHKDIPANDDGSIPHAVSVDNTGIFINDDVPEPLFYQLRGYCLVHGIPIIEP